jgi:hypothetical protein
MSSMQNIVVRFIPRHSTYSNASQIFSFEVTCTKIEKINEQMVKVDDVTMDFRDLDGKIVSINDVYIGS